MVDNKSGTSKIKKSMSNSPRVREGERLPAGTTRERPFRSQLERLFAERGIAPKTYGLFFRTQEGKSLPGNRPGHTVESESGFLVTADLRHYSYWKDLDKSGKVALEWKEVEPEPEWERNMGYITALRRAQRAKQ